VQDRPEKSAILAAVARFLAKDVRPALADPALGFRALVAENLLTIVVAELAHEEADDAAELSRLRALLPDLPAADTSTATARRAAIAALNRELQARIRDGRVSGPELRAHLKATLAEKLAVSSPRFDLSQAIE
jgi:hypothetical protein